MLTFLPPAALASGGNGHAAAEKQTWVLCAPLEGACWPPAQFFDKEKWAALPLAQRCSVQGSREARGPRRVEKTRRKCPTGPYAQHKLPTHRYSV